MVVWGMTGKNVAETGAPCSKYQVVKVALLFSFLPVIQSSLRVGNLANTFIVTILNKCTIYS